MAFLLVATCVLLNALVTIGLLRRMSAILETVEDRLRRAPQPLGGLTAGSKVPWFELTGADGRIIDSSHLLVEPTVLLLLSSTCSPCKVLALEIAEAPKPLAEVPVIPVVQPTGPPEAAFDDLGLPVFQDLSAFAAFRNDTTPFAYAVDDRGIVIASGVASSVEHLRELARTLEEVRPSRTSTLA